jgi:OmcA/MtrC family decaheme c-type cytochrome
VRGVRAVANATLDFRPDGAAVVSRRDIVTTQACNACHTRLEAHGGARRDVKLCILCHTDSQDIDPETGNSIDFKQLVHKLHMGAALPSVVAGTPYRFVGFGGQVHDYSTVRYPGDVKDCAACHAGPDGEQWKTRPTSASCSGCHDRTWYANATPPAGYTPHTAGPRPDSQCGVCHQEQGPQPVSRAHWSAATDPTRLDVVATILDVPATPPGARPEVTFSVSVDGQPRDVLSDRLSRLRFVFSGPNSDVARFSSTTAETAADCASVTDGGACLARVDAGVFTWRSTFTLASGDEGSFTVGIEACATTDAGVRWCAPNPTRAFAVTDAAPRARRTSVTQAQCDACHQSLSAHGGTRNRVELCVSCHNPNLVLGVTVPASGATVTAAPGNLKDLVHALHAEARYPSRLEDCERCHAPGAVSSLPLPLGLLPSRSELRACGPLPDGGSGAPTDGGTTCLAAAVARTPVLEPPTSAACTSCHRGVATQAHTAFNSAGGVETCAVCHAPGRSVDFNLAHAMEP